MLRLSRRQAAHHLYARRGQAVSTAVHAVPRGRGRALMLQQFGRILPDAHPDYYRPLMSFSEYENCVHSSFALQIADHPG